MLGREQIDKPAEIEPGCCVADVLRLQNAVAGRAVEAIVKISNDMRGEIDRVEIAPPI